MCEGVQDADVQGWSHAMCTSNMSNSDAPCCALCCGVLCCPMPPLCQAMVFAVTMNSKRNALLALMIATNFVELKGQVYKRTDTNKLWGLACQVGLGC